MSSVWSDGDTERSGWSDVDDRLEGTSGPGRERRAGGRRSAARAALPTFDASTRDGLTTLTARVKVQRRTLRGKTYMTTTRAPLFDTTPARPGIELGRHGPAEDAASRSTAAPSARSAGSFHAGPTVAGEASADDGGFDSLGPSTQALSPLGRQMRLSPNAHDMYGSSRKLVSSPSFFTGTPTGKGQLGVTTSSRTVTSMDSGGDPGTPSGLTGHAAHLPSALAAIAPGISHRLVSKRVANLLAQKARSNASCTVAAPDAPANSDSHNPFASHSSGEASNSPLARAPSPGWGTLDATAVMSPMHSSGYESDSPLSSFGRTPAGGRTSAAPPTLGLLKGGPTESTRSRLHETPRDAAASLSGVVEPRSKQRHILHLSHTSVSTAGARQVDIARSGKGSDGSAPAGRLLRWKGKNQKWGRKVAQRLFRRLADAQLAQVVSFAQIEDVRRYRQVSRRWQRAAEQDVIWHAEHAAQFGAEPCAAGLSWFRSLVASARWAKTSSGRQAPSRIGCIARTPSAKSPARLRPCTALCVAYLRPATVPEWVCTGGVPERNAAAAGSGTGKSHGRPQESDEPAAVVVVAGEGFLHIHAADDGARLLATGIQPSPLRHLVQSGDSIVGSSGGRDCVAFKPFTGHFHDGITCIDKWAAHRNGTTSLCSIGGMAPMRTRKVGTRASAFACRVKHTPAEFLVSSGGDMMVRVWAATARFRCIACLRQPQVSGPADFIRQPMSVCCDATLSTDPSTMRIAAGTWGSQPRLMVWSMPTETEEAAPVMRPKTAPSRGLKKQVTWRTEAAFDNDSEKGVDFAVTDLSGWIARSVPASEASRFAPLTLSTQLPDGAEQSGTATDRWIEKAGGRASLRRLRIAMMSERGTPVAAREDDAIPRATMPETSLQRSLAKGRLLKRAAARKSGGRSLFGAKKGLRGRMSNLDKFRSLARSNAGVRRLAMSMSAEADAAKEEAQERAASQRKVKNLTRFRMAASKRGKAAVAASSLLNKSGNKSAMEAFKTNVLNAKADMGKSKEYERRIRQNPPRGLPSWDCERWTVSGHDSGVLGLSQVNDVLVSSGPSAGSCVHLWESSTLAYLGKLGDSASLCNARYHCPCLQGGLAVASYVETDREDLVITVWDVEAAVAAASSIVKQNQKPLAELISGRFPSPAAVIRGSRARKGGLSASVGLGFAAGRLFSGQSDGTVAVWGVLDSSATTMRCCKCDSYHNAAAFSREAKSGGEMVCHACRLVLSLPSVAKQTVGHAALFTHEPGSYGDR